MVKDGMKGYDYNSSLSNELKNGKGYVVNFNQNENLIFEGELVNGEKNGKSIEYSSISDFLFEGEYLKGKKMENAEKFLITI